MKKIYIRWIGTLLAAILLTLTAVMGVTFIIDPYQYYRKATFYKPVYLNDSSRFINAGLIKNFDYDSAIVGNSMTENFLTDNLDKDMGWRTIKLSMQGGTSYEDNIELNAVLKTGKVKNILTTFDVFAYDQPGAATVGEMPTYLYNDNKLDDIKYLLNFAALKKEIYNIYIHDIKVKDTRYTDLKLAYFWGDSATYTRENVFKNILDSFNLKDTKDLHLPKVNNFDKQYTGNALNNFNNNLLKYIKEHPEVNFYIALPPYSIVYWKQQQFTGVIDEDEYIINQVIQELLPMKNVRIYDFQSDKDITHNLDSYRDMVHYSHDANLYMIANLNNDKYLLTEKNWKHFRDALHNDMESYVVPEYKESK